MFRLFFKKEYTPQEFLDAYKKLVKKYGYDLAAVITLADHKNQPLPEDHQTVQALAKFLRKYKIKLMVNFKIVKTQDGEGQTSRNSL